jgi:predicted small secreted protein
MAAALPDGNQYSLLSRIFYVPEMSTAMKLLLLTFSLLFLTQTLSACNTIEGIGRDVKGAGSAISRTASETKREMQN